MNTQRMIVGAGWDAATAAKVLAGVLKRAQLAFRTRKRAGGQYFEFEDCPHNDNPDGHNHKCAAIVRADGTFAVRCCHDQHARWRDFRRAIDWEQHARMVIRELGIAPRSLPYRITNAGLIYLQRRGSRVFSVCLSNFSARIIRDVVEDDGVDVSHTFEVEAQLDGRSTRFTLSAAEFAAMNWPLDRLGARAVLFPRASKAFVRAGIQLLSGEIPTDQIYKHLGWRILGGEHVYLHADGGIGKDGPVPGVRVALPEPLLRYRLLLPSSKAALQKAVRASLRLLDVAPDEVTIPLYGAIWRVALGATDFGLQLTGLSGTGKTVLAALTQQHWGRELDAQHLPANWLSTANANELLAFYTKDALLVVDDFVPTGSHSDGARQHREADRLLRGQGNSTGRGRLRSDATLQSPKPPRGLILSTGEETPRGESLRARLFVLALRPGAVNWERVTICQQNAAEGLYAAAFAGFVRWVAPQLDSVRADMPQRLAALREQATASGQHKRTPGIVANLHFGLDLFSRFAVEAKAMTQGQGEAFLQRCWKALGAAAAAQTAVQAHAEPAQRFLELLRAAVANGKAHVAGVDGKQPVEAAALGWCEDWGEWAPAGDRIGWVNGPDLYLEPATAFAVVQRMGVQSHESLGIGEKALHKRLHEQGHLVSTDRSRGHLPIRKTLQGKVRTVLHLRAQVLRKSQ